jgi:hypothetical protein
VTRDFVRELSDAKAEKEGWYDMYMAAKNETGQAKAEIARLTAERDEVRTILAGTDINSLPYDYPTSRMAQRRMDDREKFIRMREALQRIADAPAWGAPHRWETTPSEVRQLASAALKPDTGEGT